MNPKKVRFYSSIFQEPGKEFKAGDVVEIQIMRSGKWSHAQYGNVVVTDKIIDEVVENFNADSRGIELAVDENHEPNHKALAWYKELFKKGKDSLFAKIELTKKGAEMLTDGAYKYFSPEIIFGPMKDPETGKTVKNLLTGGALTNRPFFKKMSPLMANEDATNELLEAAKAKTILSFDEKFALKSAFNDLDDAEKTEEVETQVTEQTDKPETEPKTEDDKSDEGGDDEGGSDDAATEVKASETVSPEKYNEMVEKVANLEATNKKNAVEKEFNDTFAFSDSNDNGMLNLKHKDSFVAFAMTLSSKQQEAFYEILGHADKALSEKFKEKGVNHNSNGNVASESGQSYHEAVKAEMKAKNIDYDAACIAVNKQVD